jgi:hypothetical protein
MGPPLCAVVSGGFLGSDPVRGGSVDIKRPNYGRSFEQVLHRLLHGVELFALVALGILPRIPKAESEDAIRLRVGDDYRLIHESDLLPQDGQNLIFDGLAKVSCFSGIAG